MVFSIFTQALPTGAQIQNGSISISSPNASEMQINQSTKKGIINWNTFNIDASEKTHFNQPDGGMTLNRVNPQNGVSSIFGRLSATGTIILVNQAGIHFGPSSVVDVGGIIASTSDIKNENFLNDKFIFDEPSKVGGVITNEGYIRAANNGLVALVGGAVTNTGVIEANLGTVALASGDKFTLDLTGNNLINIVVDEDTSQTLVDEKGVPVKRGVNQSGKILAPAGKVILTAKKASNVLDHAINMDGIIEANSVQEKNGEIILAAANVNVSGTIHATGKNAGQKGGKITLAGNNIHIKNKAQLDVSGDTKGGSILIGGNKKELASGKNAKKVKIDKEVVLSADAITQGNGGDIIVWSDDQTQFLGSIHSRGGLHSGNGGFVEVSGLNNLKFTGFVDTSARSATGLSGTLLIDPKFLVIETNNGSAYVEGVNNTFQNDPSSTTTISPMILALLNTHILLQANSDVIFNDALNLVCNRCNLTVQAGRSIILNNSISTRNGTIQLTANDVSALASDRAIDASGNPVGDFETLRGNIMMREGTSINAVLGNINLTVGSTSNGIFQPGDIFINSIAGNNLTVNTPQSIEVNNTVTLFGKAVMNATQGSITLNNFILADGDDVAITLATSKFINNLGPEALAPTNGTFQVWSSNPANDIRGNLAYDFKQYNAQYGTSTVLGTGNGFLYSIAPHIDVSLVGTVSKVYDATTVATLSPSNYVHTGEIDNDVITLNNPTLGQYDTKDVGTQKNITVNGIQIATAMDGNALVYGYSIDNPVSANIGIITPASLTPGLTGTVSKVYDTTTTATLTPANFTLTGVLGSDVVNLNTPTTGTFADSNAGINKIVTATGLTIGGASAGNYQLIPDNVSGAIGIITPAPLTPGLTGAISKVYDTTTTATLTPANFTLTGVLGSDVVNLNTPTTGTFADSNAGINKIVTATGLTIGDASAGNYQLIPDNVSGAIGIITPAPLTPGLTGTVSKVYDTTTTATLTPANFTLTGVLGSDVVNLNTPTTGTFADSNAGINKIVTATGLTIGGESAGNYQLIPDNVSGAIGIITPAPLTPGLTGTVSKVYDTTTTATLTPANFTLTGVLGSDVVNLNTPTTGTFADRNAGINKIVTATGLTIGGASAGNYQLIPDNVSGAIGIITPATVTPGLTGTVSKVYDTTTTATLTPANFTLTGVLGSDVVNLNTPTTGTFADSNAGINKIVTATGLTIGGASAGNYQLIPDNVSGAIGIITPAPLTPGLTGTVSKVYDTTTTATLTPANFTLTGVLGSDIVNLNTPTTGTFADSNAGINKIVTATGLTIGGASAGNYQLIPDNVSGAIGIITPATVSPGLVGPISKVFDDTVTVPLTPANFTLSGILGTDVVNLNTPTSGTFSDSLAGINKIITATGLTIGGISAGNYQLASNTVSGFGNIDPPNSGNQGGGNQGGPTNIDNTNTNPGNQNNSNNTSNTNPTINQIINATNPTLTNTGTVTNTITGPAGNNLISQVISASATTLPVVSSSLITQNLNIRIVEPANVPIRLTIADNNVRGVAIANTNANTNTVVRTSDRHLFGLNLLPNQMIAYLPFELFKVIPIQSYERTIYSVRDWSTFFRNLWANLSLNNLLLLLFAIPLLFLLRRNKKKEIDQLAFLARTALNNIKGYSQVFSRNATVSPDQEKYLALIDAGADNVLTEVVKYEKMHKLSNFNLRTYLAVIKGFAEILTNYKLGPLTPDQARYTQYIVNESNKVSELLINKRVIA